MAVACGSGLHNTYCVHWLFNREAKRSISGVNLSSSNAGFSIWGLSIHSHDLNLFRDFASAKVLIFPGMCDTDIHIDLLIHHSHISFSIWLHNVEWLVLFKVATAVVLSVIFRMCILSVSQNYVSRPKYIA